MHGNIGTLSGTKGKLEGHKWKYMEVHMQIEIGWNKVRTSRWRKYRGGN